MLADIPQRGGAEQGVGNRVKRDICVAMAGQASRVRDRRTAEHDRPFAGKAVNIESEAGA